MTFQFQEPNEADYETCRIVKLTKNERWSPQDHYDDVMDNMRHVRTIASSTSISTNDDHLVEEEFPFYDATDDDDHSYWYSSDTFACRVNRTVVDKERYFDPMDNLPKKTRMGLIEAGITKEIYSLTFHLSMDMEKWETVDVPFMQQSGVDSFIDELSYEELIGFDPNAETKTIRSYLL
jgi:hypothetical protein